MLNELVVEITCQRANKDEFDASPYSSLLAFGRLNKAELTGNNKSNRPGFYGVVCLTLHSKSLGKYRAEVKQAASGYLRDPDQVSRCKHMCSFISIYLDLMCAYAGLL